MWETHKLAILAAIALFLLSAGVLIYLSYQEEVPEPVAIEIPEKEPEEPEIPEPVSRVIGASVEGRDIEVHSYGTGEENLLFVGGIHGGYEWNSVLLAYEAMDYFEANPTAVPEGMTVTIVPLLNPDGLFEVLGTTERFTLADAPETREVTIPGRFNANDVDLNRNFDCKWQPESTWRGNVVSAGTEAFSEPEARAIRDLALELQPSAVVFWHSQASAVYASECEEGILPDTLAITNLYAEAADYLPVDVFDAYEITGDAEGWLASIGIPAITVELETYKTVEWERNLAGIEALIEYFSQEL